jgi:hypothetical protein
MHKNVNSVEPFLSNMHYRSAPIIPVLLIALLGAVAFPPEARANAGTPLMWAGMLHMVFGNALIGMGEGTLLAWLFSLPKGKCISVMIFANYASAWVGGFFINWIAGILPIDLNNG